jgi:hypothetical protein
LGGLTCALGPLNPGQQVEKTFTVIIVAAPSNAVRIFAEAIAESTSDPLPQNNQQSLRFALTPP